MKIYFAGSIRGGRDDKELYVSIIRELQKYGTVLTEHVSDKNLTDQGESFPVDYIFNRDVAWLKECDVVIAEVTTPSLGVGYEIGLAESLQKPMVFLYRQLEGKSLSAMVSGNPAGKVYVYKDMEEIARILMDYFNKK